MFDERSCGKLILNCNVLDACQLIGDFVSRTNWHYDPHKRPDKERKGTIYHAQFYTLLNHFMSAILRLPSHVDKNRNVYHKALHKIKAKDNMSLQQWKGAAKHLMQYNTQRRIALPRLCDQPRASIIGHIINTFDYDISDYWASESEDDYFSVYGAK